MHRTNMKRKTVFGKNKVPLQGGLAGFVRREVCESTVYSIIDFIIFPPIEIHTGVGM